MKTKVSIVAFLFAVFAFVPALFAGAETVSSEGAVIATTGVYDLEILNQKDNVFSLAFTILNREGIQPKIIYAVKLIRQDEFQVVVDQKAYTDDIVTLGTNESAHKKITYVAPAHLDGKYFLEVYATNPDGLLFGFVSSPEVSLKRSEKGVLADPSNCFLTVNGDKNHYLPHEGIDYLTTETLTARCALSHNFAEKTIVTPVFETRYRTSSGKVMGTEKKEAVTLLPGKTFDFSAALPKMSEPQAYDAILTFVDGAGKQVSSPIAFHYVLKGQTATINNFVLDKDYYVKGDIAILSLMWSGPADNFANSRIKPTALAADASLEISVQNSENKSCISDFTEKLDVEQGGGVEKISLPITKDCPNPVVSVKIADASGKALAENSYNIASKDIPAPAQKNTALLVILYATVFVVAAVLIAYFIKKRGKTAIPPIAIFFALIIGLGFLSFGAHKAMADSRTASFVLHSYGGWQNTVSSTFTYNLNRADRTYAPGAPIIVTGSYSNTSCSNTAGGKIEATVNGNTQTVFNQALSPAGAVGTHTNYSTTKSSYTFTAPSTAGSYDAAFTFWHGLYDNTGSNTASWLQKSGGSKYYGDLVGTRDIPFGGSASPGAISIPYTVGSPVNGSCGAAARTYTAAETDFSGGKCSPVPPTPTPAFPSPGNSVSWDCPGTGGGTTKYNCTATRNSAPVNGSCGAAARTYTAAETDFSGGKCSPVAPTPTPAFPSPGNSVSWDCIGTGGGSTAYDCTATRNSATVNGVCGSANNHVYASTDSPWGGFSQCSKGNPSNTTIPTYGNPASWTCSCTGSGCSISGTCTATRAGAPCTSTAFGSTQSGNTITTYQYNEGTAANCAVTRSSTCTNGNWNTPPYDYPSCTILSSAKSITSFRFNALSPQVAGTINQTNHTIALTVPYGTSVTALVPTIVITGVSVSPNTGVARNFTSASTYTVTAEDGSTQPYTVTVSIASPASCAIPASLGGGTRAHGAHFITYSISEGTPAACAAADQDSICNNGNWNPSPLLAYSSCTILVSCGSAADTTEPTKPKTNLCSDGSYPPVTLVSGKWTWTCGGPGGVQCQSPKGKFNFVES